MPKIEFNNFYKNNPGLDKKICEMHFTSLPDRYFSTYDEEKIFQHIKAVSKLNENKKCEFLFDRHNNKISLTIITFDFQFIFSLIAGILSTSGFNIIQGNIFTYVIKINKQIKNKINHSKDITVGKKKIIDEFAGVIENYNSFEEWKKNIISKIELIINLLALNNPDSTEKAKEIVNDWVSQILIKKKVKYKNIMNPLEINIDNSHEDFTKIKLTSIDTPFFLYSFASALSLNNIYIQKVIIQTNKNKIEDEFEVLDNNQQKIEDSESLNKLKISLILTKQFTFFLNNSANPYNSLIRFEILLDDFINSYDKNKTINLISNPAIMSELAKILGVSDFLWEDFIHIQYENFLPILKEELAGKNFCDDIIVLENKLNELLAEKYSYEEKKLILNNFKDDEIFKIDLQHILIENFDFKNLSIRLTRLAELIISKAFEINYSFLIEKYGNPKTIINMDAKFSIFGLGKLGGEALGYASDLEILVVYSDNGETDGKTYIKNREFFNILIKDSSNFITTKRQGIFQIDLRLRPYGKSGELACSLENFFEYYGIKGDAHSFEKLSLVRLRMIGGNTDFGRQVERIRDELIYTSNSINLKELTDIRNKQIKTKTKENQINVKFNIGGLVDIEYTVQILQIKYGIDNVKLRTPKISHALIELSKINVLNKNDSKNLLSAYEFLRKLINGLRILRGNADDLFLPEINSDEYFHLARRIGYTSKTGIKAEQKLHMDYETNTAIVKAFLEKYLGEESLIAPSITTIADLIISDLPDKENYLSILKKFNISDIYKAYTNIMSLCGKIGKKENFAKIAILAFDILKYKPDPDMALNNWERYVHFLKESEIHFKNLLSQPMNLEIMLSVFSGSQYLSDTLIKYPDFFNWITNQKNIFGIRKKEDIIKDLQKISEESINENDWLNKIRIYKKKEYLRIGTKDLCLNISFKDIVLELSNLADCILQTILEKEHKDIKGKNKLKTFCIMAFGKLGGMELNYSSDIDLIAVYDDQTDKIIDIELYNSIIKKIIKDLSIHTEEGQLYRVDLRLRPYGSSGSLIYSINNLYNYYLKNSKLWEIQALLKLRPVAGHLETGIKFLDRVNNLFSRQININKIKDSIKKIRDLTIKKYNVSKTSEFIDIKNGSGGIREIEFLIQGLQIINLGVNNHLLTGNTLKAMELLNQNNILNDELYDGLEKNYIFLRKVEHFLQIFEDQQIHAIPKDVLSLNALAKRVLGFNANNEIFLNELNNCLEFNNKEYNRFLNQ